jgi:hypothetical protein
VGELGKEGSILWFQLEIETTDPKPVQAHMFFIIIIIVISY